MANARIEYFKHLQKISDEVIAPERPSDPLEALEKLNKEKNSLNSLLASQYGKRRYLKHLSDTRNDLPKECTICKDEIVEGLFTTCGHSFCDGCLMSWLAKNRNCPIW